jgi:hypothetical protein
MNKDAKDNIANDIRNIEIIDPYEFVSGSKTLVNLVIKGKNIRKIYKLQRTSKGGYLMTV